LQRVEGQHLYICLAYVPPESSSYVESSLFADLLKDFAEIQALGGLLLVAGDFNAHTAEGPDCTDLGDLAELLQVSELAEGPTPDDVAVRHNSDPAKVNKWGRGTLRFLVKGAIYRPSGKMAHAVSCRY